MNIVLYSTVTPATPRITADTTHPEDGQNFTLTCNTTSHVDNNTKYIFEEDGKEVAVQTSPFLVMQAKFRADHNLTCKVSTDDGERNSSISDPLLITGKSMILLQPLPYCIYFIFLFTFLCLSDLCFLFL